VDSLVLLQHSVPVEKVKNNMRIGMHITVNIKIMVFWDFVPGGEGNKVIASTS
jgi:hypothetical protein